MAELMKRSEQKIENTWNLDVMFATDDDWQKEFDRLEGAVEGLVSYKGRLGESAKTLLECLKAQEDYGRKLMLVASYASLRKSEDSTNSFYTGLLDKVMTLYAKYAAAGSFFEPELLSLGRAKVDEFMAANDGLKHYKHYFEKEFRNDEHTLSEKEEALLAMSSKMSGAVSNVYRMLSQADFKFDKVKDGKGEEHELTHGRFITYLESPDIVLRKNTYEAFYKVFKEHKYSIAAAYAGSVESDIFYSKARGFNSCIEQSLFKDNVPLYVYENLVKVTHDALPSMYRYVELRKKRLGLSELHMHDVYTPIISDVSTDISFEDAKNTVLEALLPLGQDYVDEARKGFEDRWYDIYENVGKTTGAFSGGCYDSMPYILLNFDGKISDMFTLAHELGHSMHSLFSRRHQSPTYGNYPIFLAEVASTVNEALLLNHLLKTTTDKRLREYLLNYYLDCFKGTMFRQTMFAEFEMKMHDAAEKGTPLTVDFLHKSYLELNKLYFGESMISDDNIGYEWSRIPHFYNAFYVYKYSTGFAAAIAFSKKILNEGQAAVDAYKGFLSSGGNDYPIEILKKAGLDMSTPEPIKEAMKVFDEIVTQMENL